jgi:proteasome accessory factor B
MAAEAGVNDKTIRRDLDLFRAIGVELDETTGDFGRKRWRIKSWNQPPLCFSFDEALALYLGRQFLEPLAGTLFWDAAQRAFRKIRASLGERALDYLARLNGSFHLTTVGFSDYARKGDLIDALTMAIEESRAAHLNYQSDRATEPAFRDVYPYTFIFHKGSLYLVALDPREDRIKHYKVDRIEEVEVSQFPFRRPPDFDPAAHLAPTFGIYLEDGPLSTYKIRIAPAAARFVLESKFHQSQTVKKRNGFTTRRIPARASRLAVGIAFREASWSIVLRCRGNPGSPLPPDRLHGKLELFVSLSSLVRSGD